MILNKKRNRNSLVFWGLLLFFPLIIFMFLEGFNRGSIGSLYEWFCEHPFTFFKTYVFFFCITTVSFFLPKRYFTISLILHTILWSAVGLISYKKFQLRGEYFTPFDFYLVKEGLDISTYINDLFNPNIIFPFLIILPFFFFWVKNKSLVFFKKRLIISCISLMVALIIIFNPSYFSQERKMSNLNKYQKFGFVGGFLKVWESSKINNLSYKEADVENIVNELKINNQSDYDPNFKPNVVVVLAEALWDPTSLPNVTFKDDPIPYIRSLSRNYPSGHLISHSFGGGTINTEMEVLTGLTTRFVNEETYNSYITRPIDSLAHVLRQQGYHTTAVHTFKNWFYNRRETYKFLGFERFISLEYFNNPNYIGPFIDDRELMRRAVDEAKNTEGPDFLNIVSVTTHGPYNDTRYPDPLDLTQSNLSDSSKYTLELYSKLLSELDSSIKELIQGMNELEEPTIIAIYGDHLPMLGDDFAVYKETGYVDDISSYNAHNKLSSTSLLVWDNFSTQGQHEELRMSANFLGSYVLSKAKKAQSPIFQVNQSLFSRGLKVIPNASYYKEEGVNPKLLRDYQILQDDALFGKQFSYKHHTVEPSNSYLLGSGEMKINHVDVKNTSNQKNSYHITLTGKNFVSGVKVFINEQQCDFDFLNSSNIVLKIKKNNLSEQDTNRVVLKIIDDQGTITTESNSKAFHLNIQ